MAGLLDKLLAGDAGTVVALAGVLATLLIAAVGGLWQLYKHFSDRTAMRKHRTAVDRKFPERNFRQRLRLLCEELRDHLDRIDSETNWSHRHFVPLDAEVDVLKGERRRRRVTDLFAGIRQNRRSKLFLVLGDPGSGKSVALRKLCRDLLQEVDATGKLPIYVNLREWASAADWGHDDPPTENELRDFIFKNIRERLYRSRAFLDTCFHRMLDHGRLFLVLDSFDEIPRVMDAGEASWLIGELSQIMTRLLVGGNDGRGVVASRHFRRPRFTREDLAILEIRPFSEVKIAAAIDRAARFPDAVKRALFRERPDLASIARTPFMLGLMIDFWEAHPGRMPASQAELYQSFIERSLERAEDTLREHDLRREDVHDCASAIAREMFGSDRYGLDMPVRMLADRLPNLPVDGAIAALRQARVARPSESPTFSFCHRRFHEYFLIDYFRAEPARLPLEAISTDARWREGLVLFCEVAEEPVAKSIAAFCWGEVRKARGTRPEIGSEAYLRALHSLRFLASAFPARRHLLADFQQELAELIHKAVLESDDMLIAKHALEAAGVLSNDNAQKTISAALASGNPWLMDTAFRACRYLPSLPWKTQFLIMDLLFSIPPFETSEDLSRNHALSAGGRRPLYGRMVLQAAALGYLGFLAGMRNRFGVEATFHHICCWGSLLYIVYTRSLPLRHIAAQTKPPEESCFTFSHNKLRVCSDHRSSDIDWPLRLLGAGVFVALSILVMFNQSFPPTMFKRLSYYGLVITMV